MKQKHTPTPYWRSGSHVIANIPGYTVNWVLADCRIPESVIGGIETFPSEANAEFIVRACNAHYELIEALELALKSFPDGDVLRIEKSIISEALAKAKGDQS